MRVFWQRKLLILVVMLLVIIPAYAATKIVTPRYESTATLAVSPAKQGNDVSLFLILDQVVPLYADAATTHSTLDQARQLVGRKLADVSVQTFKGTGIMKVKARSTRKLLAQRTAEAVSSVLLTRSASGDLGIPSLKLTEIDPPALPTSPVFPRTKLTVLVAALLGLGLGLAAAVLRESLTTKVESADDLAEVAGVPVYAEIPAESAVLKMHSPEDLATQPRLRIVAEAFRDLRTNLLFTDEGIRSVLITSPDGSHGKTTVAFGLAATLARAGTRTILVDADLRRGRVAELLELPRSPGLMDVLLEGTELEDAVRRTDDGLQVLVGGRRAADPGELLTSAFPSLLTLLEREYEAVIIDSTPAIPISDARIVARYADATILVARAGSALRRQVRAAVERLGLINVRPTAAVLNYSTAVRTSSYYVQPTGEESGEKLPAQQLSERRGAARSRSTR
ncbi:MAG TPA: CpsD/CapB family tyrosine-protein kinase [Gaiellaceae bacterium]|nr:CpsD/CapB family tyrosine-protein kinase [Gaiellaceae bacterium]